MTEDGMDLSGAAEMLKEMLSGEEGQQSIRSILGMLNGEAPNEEHPPGMATGGIDPENLAMLMKMQTVMQRVTSRSNGAQTQLLTALRPFLKPSRRERVDKAVQILRVGQVLSILNEESEGM